VEIGVLTFADRRHGEIEAEQRVRELMEIEPADAVGLDVFGVGEHLAGRSWWAARKR
jgi:hypothetical protein